jgi:hypothetical protein
MVLMAVVVVAMIASLVACGGDSKQKPPAIIVTFDPNFLPPASLNVGLTAGIAADVANDTGGSGDVNWTCAPTNNCGMFTPTPTHSTAPTTYQAPAQTGTVTVTTTSVTDNTKSVSAMITIN